MDDNEDGPIDPPMTRDDLALAISVALAAWGVAAMLIVEAFS